MYKGVQLKSKLLHTGTYRPQHFIAARIFVQQCSYATFVSSLLHSRKQIFYPRFRFVGFSFSFFTFEDYKV